MSFFQHLLVKLKEILSDLDQVFVNATDFLIGLFPPPLQPWIALLIPIAAIAVVAPAIMMYLTWLERKIIARIQNRFGPDRVGTYGLLQPLADGLKMLIKEDIVPQASDRLLHLLAPILAVVPAILLFAVIPFGRNLHAIDLNVGLLYILAIGSISSYAIFMGGWASRNKFSMLGAMRAVAQIISYEVPGVLSVVAVIMVTQTLSLVSIVEAQQDLWFVFTPWGFVGALAFFLSGIAEVNRTPFDMPEAESEIVAGFHTEYSGMKFALWYMAEFLEAFAICAFTTTLFLGGWHGPAIPVGPFFLLNALIVFTAKRLPLPVKVVVGTASVAAAIVYLRQPIPSWMWFFGKTYALVFVLVWLRGTFPRLRVDQLMGFAWKFLLPLSLVNILAAGFWVLLPMPVAVLPIVRVGTLISALLLLASAWLLIRLNAPAPLVQRTYVFAE